MATRKDMLEVRDILREVAERQTKSEERLSRVERAIEKLTEAIDSLRSVIGGLSRSVSYALENEAYRFLPSFLRAKYGIRVKEKFVRTEIRGREVNFLAKAERGGKEIVVVGEAVLRLESLAKAVEKVKQVKELAHEIGEEYGVEAIPILVTHMAKRSVLEAAKEEGVIIVQSFEWIQPEG